MSVGALVPEKIKGSRRMRRVAWTISGLLALLLIGAVVGWRIHKENEPEEYTPGEASKDITSVLERTATSAATPKAEPVNTVMPPRGLVSRTIDPLAKNRSSLPPGAPE